MRTCLNQLLTGFILSLPIAAIFYFSEYPYNYLYFVIPVLVIGVILGLIIRYFAKSCCERVVQGNIFARYGFYPMLCLSIPLLIYIFVMIQAVGLQADHVIFLVSLALALSMFVSFAFFLIGFFWRQANPNKEFATNSFNLESFRKRVPFALIYAFPMSLVVRVSYSDFSKLWLIFGICVFVFLLTIDTIYSGFCESNVRSFSKRPRAWIVALVLFVLSLVWAYSL